MQWAGPAGSSTLQLHIELGDPSHFLGIKLELGWAVPLQVASSLWDLATDIFPQVCSVQVLLDGHVVRSGLQSNVSRRYPTGSTGKGQLGKAVCHPLPA